MTKLTSKEIRRIALTKVINSLEILVTGSNYSYTYAQLFDRYGGRKNGGRENAQKIMQDLEMILDRIRTERSDLDSLV